MLKSNPQALGEILQTESLAIFVRHTFEQSNIASRKCLSFCGFLKSINKKAHSNSLSVLPCAFCNHFCLFFMQCNFCFDQRYFLRSAGRSASLMEEVIRTSIFHFAAQVSTTFTNSENAAISFPQIFKAESMKRCVMSLLEA